MDHNIIMEIITKIMIEKKKILKVIIEKMIFIIISNLNEF
jgi:hypothetical protein